MEHYAILFTGFVLFIYYLAVQKNRFELYGLSLLASAGWLFEFWDQDTTMLGICMLVLLFTCLGRGLWVFFGSKTKGDK